MKRKEKKRKEKKVQKQKDDEAIEFIQPCMSKNIDHNKIDTLSDNEAHFQLIEE